MDFHFISIPTLSPGLWPLGALFVDLLSEKEEGGPSHTKSSLSPFFLWRPPAGRRQRLLAN